MKTGGHDAKRTKFHMKLHRICTYKTKYARVIIMSNVFFACDKLLKDVQKCRKRGGVNAKRAVENKRKEFIKKIM